VRPRECLDKAIDAERWTSKVGDYQDIQHLLRALEGDEYGCVVLFMKRGATWSINRARS